MTLHIPHTHFVIKAEHAIIYHWTIYNMSKWFHVVSYWSCIASISSSGVWSRAAASWRCQWIHFLLDEGDTHWYYYYVLLWAYMMTPCKHRANQISQRKGWWGLLRWEDTQLHSNSWDHLTGTVGAGQASLGRQHFRYQRIATLQKLERLSQKAENNKYITGSTCTKI